MHAQGQPLPTPRGSGSQVAASWPPEPDSFAAIAHLGQRAILYGEFTEWLQVMAGPEAELIRKASADRGQAMKQYLELRILAVKAKKEKIQDTREFKAQFDALAQVACVRFMLDAGRAGSDGQKLQARAENPTETELKAYFEANRDRFASPERFTVRHILVRLKGSLGAGRGGLTGAEAQLKLAGLQQALQAGGRFENLARTASDDGETRDKGGLCQDIPFGQFPRAFEQAVRDQEIGKVGVPVRTEYGYHLIQVESRAPRTPAAFEQVKEAVRKAMLPERQRRVRAAFIDQAKGEAGYRPNGSWARTEWQLERAQSLNDSKEGASTEGKPVLQKLF
jgi:parvulin-like peptidyl-prolyl isomerase